VERVRLFWKNNFRSIKAIFVLYQPIYFFRLNLITNSNVWAGFLFGLKRRIHLVKSQRVFWTWAMVIVLSVGLTLTVGQAMAEGTMGEVINELAVLLKMPAADLIILLYPGGFNAASPANERGISDLYWVVNNAINSGQIPGNAATLISKSSSNAGVPGEVITAGITAGTALTQGAGSRGSDAGRTGNLSGTGSSGGGGGGGGAVSLSR
jgi:uncharacterized membrane protein YgcG